MQEHKGYIDENMQEHRYEDEDTTLLRSVLGIGVINPIFESSIKNAYARNNGTALYNAINNGGYYSNYTIMGGHTIFGGEGSFLRKVPGIKKLYKKTAPGEHSRIFDIKNDFGFQYIDAAKNNDSYKTVGKIEANDMLESGFGFGTKYNFTKTDKTIFNNFLQDLPANELRNEQELTGYIEESIRKTLSDNFFYGKEIDNKSLNKIDLEKADKKFMEFINVKEPLNYNEKVIEMTEGILTKDEISKINFNKKNAKEELTKVFKNKINKMKIEKNSQLIPMLSETENAKKIFNKIDKIVDGADVLNDAQLKKLSSMFDNDIVDYGVNVINDIFQKEGVAGIKEKALHLAFVEGGLDDLAAATAKNIVKATKISKGKMILDTMLGNQLGMFVAGAIGGPAAIAAQVALAVASSVSIAHQENSINEYTASRLANYNDGDFLESEKSVQSLNSHLAISSSNYQDFGSVLANKNISKNSLREIDPINVDNSLADSKNFTIF